MHHRISSICLVLVAFIAIPSNAEVSSGAEIRAQFSANHAALISSSLTGRITEFKQRVGDRVQKGELVVSFDCQRQLAESQITETRLLSSQYQVAINQKLADLESISDLELEMSQAQVKIDRAEYNRALAITSYCKIHAPFSGIITEKHANAFEYITEGGALFKLVDTDNLETEMIVPSVQLPKFKPGRPFEIYVGETGQVVTVIVDRIGGAIDPVSESVKVFGRLKDQQRNLLPGMSGAIVGHLEP